MESGIYDSPTSRIAVFGGKILVSISGKDKEVVLNFTISPELKEIGTPVESGPDPLISLVFNDIRSVDAVVKHLNEIRNILASSLSFEEYIKQKSNNYESDID